MLQIEGEEAELNNSTDNFSTAPKGGKAPAKKAPAAKGAKVVGLEEITDNRPRIIKFKHDCAELNNGIGL